MFKKFVAALSAVCALVGTPVLAADPIVTEPTSYDPAPATSWTGAYIGAWGGFRVGDIVNDPVCTVGICATDIPLDGLYGGVNAGYDYQLDQNWVIGAFVTVPVLKPTGSASLLDGAVNFAVDPNWAVTGAVRVGYAVENLLPYAFVGAAAANVTVTSSLSGVSSSATHTGAVAGVGLEYKIADSWSVDGRYTLGMLGRGTYDFGGGASSYSETSHNFSLGVNYRF